MEFEDWSRPLVLVIELCLWFRTCPAAAEILFRTIFWIFKDNDCQFSILHSHINQTSWLDLNRPIRPRLRSTACNSDFSSFPENRHSPLDCSHPHALTIETTEHGSFQGICRFLGILLGTFHNWPLQSHQVLKFLWPHPKQPFSSKFPMRSKFLPSDPFCCHVSSLKKIPQSTFQRFHSKEFLPFVKDFPLNGLFVSKVSLLRLTGSLQQIPDQFICELQITDPWISQYFSF